MLLLCYALLVVLVVCLIGPLEAIVLISGALLIALALLRPLWLLSVLPLAGALSGWHFSVASLNVRVDQALALLLGGALLWKLLCNSVRLKITKMSMFVLMYLFVNTLSSLLSVNPRYSLLQTVNLASAILCYFVALMFIQRKDGYEHFLWQVLVAGFLAMIYGVLAFVLGILGIDIGGANVHSGVVSFGAFGTMREPNIFGSYSASMLILGTALLSGGHRPLRQHKYFLRIFVGVALAALVLSFARAAWVGALVGLAALWLFEGSGWRALKRFFVLGAVASALLVGLFYTGAVQPDHYKYKVVNLFNFEEGTGQYRALIWMKAWDNFVSHPWVGNGTFSYSYMNPEDAVDGTASGNAWISNLLLLTAHDTGLIGILSMLLLLWGIIATASRARKATLVVSIRAQMMGYQSAFYCLLVAYMATSAFSLGFTWILVALISLGAEFATSDSQRNQRENRPN